ncbi:4'-phosphopantetheinyl transferase family protein [Paenibacillus provencensis]|uniref:4'-phosphopantetheinyl transferase family protein n=1 Tax=Paenibacillus provencensis TaxID=441151 RepID=A0ABW3PSY5_9BACL|nr:4'-phosphopantetheinyl transferase superfamily protein [Paenibacillus sp. MER 78]MCM3129332.1 4'-phosphopantetheinyl transferase superfamily protein [Paenibacillus sp. MER 78]
MSCTLEVWIHYASAQGQYILGPELRNALNDSEVRRMLGYRTVRDRAQFAASRAFLKYVLSQHLGCSPQSVQLDYHASGKPFVRQGIEFNLAHTDNLTCVAISGSCPVGVDVERIRDMLRTERIASRFLTPSEQKYCLAAGNERDRTRILLQILTRKEALAKATGSGIGGQWLKLNTLADDHTWIRHSQSESGESYTTRPLYLSNDYIGSVCYQGKGPMSLKYRTIR